MKTIRCFKQRQFWLIILISTDILKAFLQNLIYWIRPATYLSVCNTLCFSNRRKTSRRWKKQLGRLSLSTGSSSIMWLSMMSCRTPASSCWRQWEEPRTSRSGSLSAGYDPLLSRRRGWGSKWRTWGDKSAVTSFIMAAKSGKSKRLILKSVYFVSVTARFRTILGLKMWYFSNWCLHFRKQTCFGGS